MKKVMLVLLSIVLLSFNSIAIFAVDAQKNVVLGTITKESAFRNYPGLESGSLGSLKKGTKVQILAKEVGGWYHIKHNYNSKKPITGWVPKSFLSVDSQKMYDKLLPKGVIPKIVKKK